MTHGQWEKRQIAASLFNNTDQYADIMRLPHHVSRRHPQMSQADRAAQFAPFAALTGYHELIRDTGDRVAANATSPLEALQNLRAQLHALQKRLAAHTQLRVRLTYFDPMTGETQETTGQVSAYAADRQELTLKPDRQLACENLLTLTILPD